jgi:glucokinase
MQPACHVGIIRIVSYLQGRLGRPGTGGADAVPGGQFHTVARPGIEWSDGTGAPGTDPDDGAAVDVGHRVAGGRRPAREDGARESAVVLALDFGGTKIAAAVQPADAAAGGPDQLGQRAGVIDTEPELGAEANVTRALSLARRLVGRSPVAAVGACTFGIPHENGVALSPAVEGWERLPLRRLLADAFGAPVAVVTDVKAAAAAEARHGALAGADPAIYVNLGTGLAVAIVANGVVLKGAHGAAGEIGYNLLRTGGDRPVPNGGGSDAAGRERTAVPDAVASYAGSRVLEDVVSGMGLARALGIEGGSERGSGDGRRSADDAARVARLFAAGWPEDPGGSHGPEQAARHGGAGNGLPTGAPTRRHAAILLEFLDELCFQLVNLTIAIDPERIAVGGGLVRSWERIEGPLRDALEAHVPFPPQLVLGAYPFDAALRGAIDVGVALAARAGGAAGAHPAACGVAPRPKGTSTDVVHAMEGGDPC